MTGYKGVHDFLACVALLAGYKKLPRQQRRREVSTASYHNTFAITTSEDGATMARSGADNQVARGTISRMMVLTISKHITTMQQVKVSSEWQITMEQEADKLLTFLWWLAWKRREPTMGFRLNEATSVVEPDSEKEGNFFKIVLTVPVTYVTEVEMPDDNEIRHTGERPNCPEEGREDGHQ